MQVLIEKNEDLKVIAVGDDDQNIYAWRGSDAKYFQSLIKERQAKKYELTQNYRSKKNLVEFANHFVSHLTNRLKETPIYAKEKENGRIKIIHYPSSNYLIAPLVKDILKAGFSGTTAILTRTNEAALQITGLLLKEGQPAKLIDSNARFNLADILEIRFFLSSLQDHESGLIIDDGTWEEAKRNLKNKFEKSSKLETLF